MPRFPRLFAFVTSAAVVGGLGLAAATPAVAARRPAVTITASSEFQKVSGFTWVYYRPAADDIATVTGTASNVSTGDTVTLYAKAFGAKKFSATGKPVTLTADSLGNAPYSFTVHPSRETEYEAEVNTQDDLQAISPAQPVYVTYSFITAKRIRESCSRGQCTYTYRRYVQTPASAYKSEAKKHWYLYLAVTGVQPAYIYLAKHGSATKAHKVNSGESYVTLTFRFASHKVNPDLFSFACIKDTESVNGIGLPGHHGCGNKKLQFVLPYVG